MQDLYTSVPLKELAGSFADRFILMLTRNVAGKSTSTNSSLPPSFTGVEKVLNRFLEENLPLPKNLGFKQIIVKGEESVQYVLVYSLEKSDSNQIGYRLSSIEKFNNQVSLSQTTYYRDGTFSILMDSATKPTLVHYLNAPEGSGLPYVIAIGPVPSDHDQTNNSIAKDEEDPPPSPTAAPKEATEPVPAQVASPAEELPTTPAPTEPERKAEMTIQAPASPLYQLDSFENLFPKEADKKDSPLSFRKIVSISGNPSELDSLSIDELMEARRQIDLNIGYRQIKATVDSLLAKGFTNIEVCQALGRCFSEIRPPN